MMIVIALKILYHSVVIYIERGSGVLIGIGIGAGFAGICANPAEHYGEGPTGPHARRDLLRRCQALEKVKARSRCQQPGKKKWSDTRFEARLRLRFRLWTGHVTSHVPLKWAWSKCPILRSKRKFPRHLSTRVVVGQLCS